MKQLLVICSLSLMMMFFQNCGDEVKFSNTGPGSAKGEIVPLDENGDVTDLGDGTKDGGGDDNCLSDCDSNTGGNGGGSSDDGCVGDCDTTTGDNGSDDDTCISDCAPPSGDDDGCESDCGTTTGGNGGGSGGGHGDHDDNDDDYDSNTDNDDLVYVCILDGPGKSNHAGLDGVSVTSQSPTPEAICTTRAACNNLIATILPVKEVVRRGFCGKNPNVHNLTYEEVAELVAGQLAN